MVLFCERLLVVFLLLMVRFFSVVLVVCCILMFEFFRRKRIGLRVLWLMVCMFVEDYMLVICIWWWFGFVCVWIVWWKVGCICGLLFMYFVLWFWWMLNLCFVVGWCCLRRWECLEFEEVYWRRNWFFYVISMLVMGRWLIIVVVYVFKVLKKVGYGFFFVVGEDIFV